LSSETDICAGRPLHLISAQASARVFDSCVSTGFACEIYMSSTAVRVAAMKEKPEQAAIKKLRDLSHQLDIARRSQRAATTELTKTKSDSARRPSRKTPPR
jgi:hypothetical protein